MSGAFEVALLVVTICCVLANAAEVAGKAVRAQFVLQNAAEVGLQPRWLPYLAVLEGAGVVGLVAGLFGLRAVGLAAAVGLVLFFVGAVAVHIRAGVLHNIAFPAAFLASAVAAAGYFAWAAG